MLGIYFDRCEKNPVIHSLTCLSAFTHHDRDKKMNSEKTMLQPIKGMYAVDPFINTFVVCVDLVWYVWWYGIELIMAKPMNIRLALNIL